MVSDWPDVAVRLRAENGNVVAEIPNRALTDEAPLYKRPMSVPDYLADAKKLDLDRLGARDARLKDDGQVLLELHHL